MDVQIEAKQPSPRAEVIGRAWGIFFFIFFGGGWAMAGGSTLAGAAYWGVIVVTICVTIALLVSAILLIRAARKLPSENTPEAQKRGREAGRAFGIIFGVEFLVIFVAAFLLGQFQMTSLIMPVIAFIVGLHFLPLASVFHMKVYYLTGLALVLLGVIVVILVFARGEVAGTSDLGDMIAGLGSALILWLTSLANIRQGREMLQSWNATAE